MTFAKEDPAGMLPMVARAHAEARAIDNRQYSVPMLNLRAWVGLLAGDLGEVGVDGLGESEHAAGAWRESDAGFAIANAGIEILGGRSA